MGQIEYTINTRNTTKGIDTTFRCTTKQDLANKYKELKKNPEVEILNMKMLIYTSVKVDPRELEGF